MDLLNVVENATLQTVEVNNKGDKERELNTEMTAFTEHQRLLLAKSWAMNFAEMSTMFMQMFMTFHEVYPQFDRLVEIDHLVNHPQADWMADRKFSIKTIKLAQVAVICAQNLCTPYIPDDRPSSLGAFEP